MRHARRSHAAREVVTSSDRRGARRRGASSSVNREHPRNSALHAGRLGRRGERRLPRTGGAGPRPLSSEQPLGLDVLNGGAARRCSRLLRPLHLGDRTRVVGRDLERETLEHDSTVLLSRGNFAASCTSLTRGRSAAAESFSAMAHLRRKWREATQAGADEEAEARLRSSTITPVAGCVSCGNEKHYAAS